MSDNRYLEAIKHLLFAETYFRRREEAEAAESKRRPSHENPQR